jgi:hypothetical protein
LSDVSSERETAVAAVDSLSLSRLSFRTLRKRGSGCREAAQKRLSMKLDFIGTLFDGEIMVFILCMNQAGQKYWSCVHTGSGQKQEL